MVSTRRNTIAPTEAPAADPQPSSSPRKSRRAVPRSQTTVSTTTEDDRMWAAKYRAIIQQERDAANKNIFTRALHRIKLTWHHFRISMVPFMLDPWEQALYILGIVVLLYGLVQAIQQSVSIASSSSISVTSWVATLKPRILNYLNNA